MTDDQAKQAKTPAPGGPEPEPPDEDTEPALESADSDDGATETPE